MTTNTREAGRSPRTGPDEEDAGDTGAASSPRAAPLTVRDRAVAYATDLVPPGLRDARWRIDGRTAAVIAGLAIVAAALAFVVFARGPRADPLPVAITTAPVDADAILTGDATSSPTPPEIVVDVAGKVANPGVVRLRAGARVVDALEAAGGALPGVDLSTLNLARVLVDGEQVAVGIEPAPDGPPPGTAGDQQEVIDLNTATEAQLDELPGVGPVLAARIVAWRSEHGRFTRVDELLEVSGIGDATLADIAPLVRV